MQQSPSKRYEKLMQVTISQQVNFPSRRSGLANLARVLHKSSKTEFTPVVNESDLFKTCYYEDIEPLGLNVEPRIEPREIQRCIHPRVATPGGSLEEYTQYCVRKVAASSSQALLDLNKELEYYFKGISKEAMMTSLNVWLPFFCEVCQRYDTWDHQAHLNKAGKSVRKPIELRAIDLRNQLQLLKIDSSITCDDETNCIYHQKDYMRWCGHKGQADDRLLEINSSVDILKTYVQEELEKIKSVIDHSLSYCMLRILLWGTQVFTRNEKNPTCLELYCCVRKILGEPILDLHVLERKPIEVELEIIEAAPATSESEDIVILDGPPRPPKYYMSKSNVCDGGGIFTAEPLKRGMVIGSYLGEVLNGSDRSAQLRSTYQELMNHSSYSFQSKNNVDIDALFYGNFTRMLNHMPLTLANCRFVKNDYVTIVTFRDIQPGQELFVDYGTSYTEPWKEEFDRMIKALKNQKTAKESIDSDDQPRDQEREYIINGKIASKERRYLENVESPTAEEREDVQRRPASTICRKSNVTLVKTIEVIELDIE